MIVRILGEGQFEVADVKLDELNVLDEALVAAIDADDREGFARCLQALLVGVRQGATPVPVDHLGPSDLVLPGPDASLGEVRELLREDGLLPG